MLLTLVGLPPAAVRGVDNRWRRSGQYCTSLNEAGVFHCGIDPSDGSSDTRIDRMNVAVYLGVTCNNFAGVHQVEGSKADERKSHNRQADDQKLTLPLLGVLCIEIMVLQGK